MGGYAISNDPAAWLVGTQEHAGETYFIVNVLPVTEKWAKKYGGELKGM